MAGLEVVVRPVVFPDIRPRARQSLPPQDDPERGLAVIQGNPAGTASMSYSWSTSSSHSNPKETERRSDQVRVYQQKDDGTVNKDNFVDLKVPNRITMEEGKGKDKDLGVDTRKYYYKRPEESENVEITRKDIIEKSDPRGFEK
jgi:hypothetical protein